MVGITAGRQKNFYNILIYSKILFKTITCNICKFCMSAAWLVRITAGCQGKDFAPVCTHSDDQLVAHHALYKAHRHQRIVPAISALKRTYTLYAYIIRTKIVMHLSKPMAAKGTCFPELKHTFWPSSKMISASSEHSYGMFVNCWFLESKVLVSCWWPLGGTGMGHPGWFWWPPPLFLDLPPLLPLPAFHCPVAV